MGRRNRARLAYLTPRWTMTDLSSVSVLSSTLTPTIHPTFPLRFVSFGSIFPNPALAAPFPDLVVDMIGSYVGARRPGGPSTLCSGVIAS